MDLLQPRSARLIARFAAAAALGFACQAAHAGVHMCLDAQGNKSYTDKPCASLDSYTSRIVESTDAGGKVCKELLERVNSTLKSMADLDSDVSPGYGANVYGKDLEATRTLYERRCGRKAPSAPPSKYANSADLASPTAARTTNKSTPASLEHTPADTLPQQNPREHAAASTPDVDAGRQASELDKGLPSARLVGSTTQIAKQISQLIIEFWWIPVIGVALARLKWLKSRSAVLKPFANQAAGSSRAFLRALGNCRRYILARASQYHRDILAYIQRRKDESASGDFVARTIKYSLSTGDYQLLNNVLLPSEDGTTQVDLILVSKFGVFVIREKDRPGEIHGDANSEEWKQITGAMTSTFKNPLHQNGKHVRTVMDLARLDEQKVHSLIAFSGLAKFATEMPGNVTAGMDFLNYIKSKRQQILSVDDITKITRAIELARFKPARAANVRPAPVAEVGPRPNKADESTQT
jgi:hypothetical protein